MSAPRQLMPDIDVLLALAPEELAPLLLQMAKSQLQNGVFNPSNVSLVTVGTGGTSERQSSYVGREREADLALAESWNWLEVHGLIVPATGFAGNSGYFFISRRGQAITTDREFDTFREAASFPKSMLHSSIADKVWLDLARGDLADAVFTAFRAVEEAVRKAGGYTNAEIGVDLMRKAFNPSDGPLTDMQQEKGEREALAHMFAGAIGSYKNPHSHRTVTITDPREAQEMVVHASHLLRITEARAAKRNGGVGRN
jgi:uncharacterized protein (TIGR02391 family)